LARTAVRTWRPARAFDVWHDRAVFHFLVEPVDPVDRAGYGEALRRGTRAGSLAVVGTFAAHGRRRARGCRWPATARRLREAVTAASSVDCCTWVVLRRPR
jgi:hypothetical protein